MNKLFPLIDGDRSGKFRAKTQEEVDAFYLDSEGNKRCSVCKIYKPMDHYHKNKSARYGLSIVCKQCAITKSKLAHKRRMETDEAYRAAKKSSYTKRMHGITLEQYSAKLSSQGACAICGTTSPKGGWHLDHNHETGKLRGFLCNPCNRGIGYLQDNVEILMNAINYLNAHSKEGSRQ